MDFGKMLKDGEAMKRFGNTVVVWNEHTRKPQKVLDAPGAPLEIRCAWQPKHNDCFTTTALTSKIWLIHADDSGDWQTTAVADIGDPSQVPLPVDIAILRSTTSCGSIPSWTARRGCSTATRWRPRWDSRDGACGATRRRSTTRPI